MISNPDDEKRRAEAELAQINLREARRREAAETKREAEESRREELERRREESEAREEQKRRQSISGRIQGVWDTVNEKINEKKDAFVNRATEITINTAKSKTFWVWFLLGLILFISAYYKNIFGFRTFVLGVGLTIIGLLAILTIIIFIGWGFISGLRNGDMARLFIAGALSIWLLDMAPAWMVPGWPPYSGFELPPLGLLSLSLLPVLTSSFTFSLFYINMVLKIIKKEYIAFILAFGIILVSNYFIPLIVPSYININFSIPFGQYLMILVFLILGVVAWKFDKNYKGGEVAGLFSSLYAMFVFAFFWLNSGWQGNIRAWLHAIFIILFGFVYIKQKERENPYLTYIYMPTLLIIDFFGYGFLWNSDHLFLRFIPPLTLFVIPYCYVKESNEVDGKKKATYPVMAFILLVTFFLIMTVNVAGLETNTLPFVAKQGATFSEFYSSFTGNLRELIEGRLDIATAGLYRGSVEKNRYESLGVYFGNIRAADPRFYTDEPITVWGTIRSKTYKDAVIINFSCYRWKDSKRIRADQIIPNIMFPIFTLEEVDTQCTFLPKPKDDPLETKPGPNIVIFSAEYNFATDAYLKAYFIDRERFRANAREGVDSLTQFGIKDKNPIAVFTNGPVEIGMGTISPITVSDGYAVKPSISITLTNRKEIQDKDKKIISRWDGKIKNITELVLLVPPGIELTSINPVNPDLNPCKAPKDSPARLNCPCSMPFEPYDIHKCYTSCTSKVLEPCNKACINSNPKDEPQRACISECDTALNRCNDECKFLFEPEESVKGQYKGYALDVGSLDFRDLNKDIDKHRSFVCRFDPSPEVLDDTPITTRYFRVRARYNYVVENSVTVNVEQPPAGIASPTLTYDFDTGLYEEYIPTPPPPFIGPYTNLDQYFKSKGSILEGTGQCILDVEKETRVPALVILSVANLESDKSGGLWTSLSGLARLSNALFGIKCTTDYINRYCTFADKRLCCKGYSKSSKDIIYEPSAPNVYRAYQNYCESFRDFGRLISTETRYSKAMLYTNNPEQMVREIREAKYATDPAWANLVIGRMRTVKADLDKIGTVVT